MEFRKYHHIERYGTTAVEGIEKGECYVFPKLDGSNASIWLNDIKSVSAGSRRRELSIDDDNAGFCKYAIANEAILAYLEKHPTHRLYGEWLVPHSLKTYKEDAWRKFYVLDVCTDIDDEEKSSYHIPYNKYKPLLEEFGIEYIPPIAVIKDGSYENFIGLLETNNFLIKDDEGFGEGIVIKNYDFVNRFGRTIWAKIITKEFKEKHKLTMGGQGDPDEAYIIEETIINDFFTEALIEKEFAKFENENGEFTGKLVPKFFGVIWYEFINEESWNIIKKYKNPTVNYKTLNNLCIRKIKETLAFFKGGR